MRTVQIIEPYFILTNFPLQAPLGAQPRPPLPPGLRQDEGGGQTQRQGGRVRGRTQGPKSMEKCVGISSILFLLHVYRVSHLLVDLGWLDMDLGRSKCPSRIED